jgi:hypothetical protein
MEGSPVAQWRSCSISAGSALSKCSWTKAQKEVLSTVGVSKWQLQTLLSQDSLGMQKFGSNHWERWSGSHAQVLYLHLWASTQMLPPSWIWSQNLLHSNAVFQQLLNHLIHHSEKSFLWNAVLDLTSSTVDSIAHPICLIKGGSPLIASRSVNSLFSPFFSLYVKK